MGIHIRWMIRRDLGEVRQIELEKQTNCWTDDEILLALRQRNCIGMVAEKEEKVVGFIIYELHKRHLFISNFGFNGETEVIDSLINKLKSKLSTHRRVKLETVVSEYDLQAQLHLKRHGFTANKVFFGYFDENHAAGYKFTFSLNQEMTTFEPEDASENVEID